MQDIFFEIDFGAGFQKVDPPLNWRATKLQRIWVMERPQFHLQSILYEWAKDTATKITQYQTGGLSGGTGLLEGPGLRIFIGRNYQQIFDGCLNTADPAFSIEIGIVKCPIKESGKGDWFMTASESITFAYLASTDYTQVSNYNPAARIVYQDYKLVPYTRSAAPDDNSQLLMLSVTTFIMVKEAYSIIQEIIQKVKEIAAATFFWSIILTVIGLIVYLLYFCLIVIECISLTQKIIDIILPPVKYKLAMREVDLFKKLCAYFNIKFISSIYGEGVPVAYRGRYVNATWMPTKQILPTQGTDPLTTLLKRPANELNSSTSFGYFEGTAKQYIDVMCKKYNASFIVKGGYAYFEMRFNFNFANPFQLPNEGAVGYAYNYPAPYGFNTSGIKATYMVRYQKDEAENNTYNDYTGTFCLANTVANIVRVQTNQLLEGSEIVDLPMSLARRKNYLTNVEKNLIKAISDFEHLYTVGFAQINKVHNFLQSNSFLNTPLSNATSNSSVNLAINDFLLTMATSGFPVSILIVDAVGQLVPDPNFDYGKSRIGWMVLSGDITGVPKSFIGVDNGAGDWTLVDVDAPGTYHDANYANALMNEFHSYNLIKNPFDSTGNNQWVLFKDKKFKMGQHQWNQIGDNNELVAADGQKGKFDEITWDIFNETAEGVNYRIKKDWTNNLKVTITNDNG